MKFIQNKDKINTAVDSIKKSDATGFASTAFSRFVGLIVTAVCLLVCPKTTDAQEAFDPSDGLVRYFQFNGTTLDKLTTSF